MFSYDLKIYSEKRVSPSAVSPRGLESDITDTLVITQIIEGPFFHDGPRSYEEVYQEDRKPTPGAREEKIKARLKKELGE